MRLFTIPLLQRYILFELLKVFSFLLSILTILLVFVGVFREAAVSGMGPFQALQILPYIVPTLLPFTIPATSLLAICIVYGRMAGDREVTAAKAAGINVLSLLWPAFLLGAVLSVCSLLLYDQAIPWGMKNIRKVGTALMEEIFLDRLRTQRQVTDVDRGYSISVWRVDGKMLIYPTFHYAPPGRSPITVQAQEATMRFDLDAGEVVLSMIRGNIDASGERKLFVGEEEWRIPLPSESIRTKPRHMSIRDIRAEAGNLSERLETSRRRRDLETAMALVHGDFDRLTHPDLQVLYAEIREFGEPLDRLRTEIQSRFALSSSCFFFALIGAPYAILQERRQFLTTFFFCFGPILLLYYPLALLALNLSKSGTVHPVTLWIGNAVLLAVGWYILRKVLKH